MATVYAVILAGGVGARVGGDRPKQLLPLNDRPVIAWTLERFQIVKGVDRIIIVSPRAYLEDIRDTAKKFGFDKVTDIIEGGDTRQQSAYNAITSRVFNEDDIILFHDAARPFVSGEIIERCIVETREYGAAGVYVPAVDTITEGEDGRVRAILERSRLFYTQTPQSFTYSVIRDAHEKALREGIDNATDDVSLAIAAGHEVRIVPGDFRNQKITSTHDYRVADLMARQGMA